jgi:hypothetical protein
MLGRIWRLEQIKVGICVDENMETGTWKMCRLDHMHFRIVNIIEKNLRKNSGDSQID